MQESVDLLTIVTSIIVYGLPTTLLLTGLGVTIGFCLGLILALMRTYGTYELQFLADGYEKILRGIPLLVLIFIFSWTPQIFWFIAAEFRILAGVVLALSLRSAAYQSQLYRGAIMSVSEGQMQAARAIGMSTMSASRHVVLPQALRIAVPGFSNEYAVVIKDTSFASAVGAIEIFRIGRSNAMLYPELWIPIMLIVAIIYLIFTYPITKYAGEKMTKQLRALGLGGGKI